MNTCPQHDNKETPNISSRNSGPYIPYHHIVCLGLRAPQETKGNPAHGDIEF